MQIYSIFQHYILIGANSDSISVKNARDTFIWF